MLLHGLIAVKRNTVKRNVYYFLIYHSFKIKLGDVEVTNNNTVKYLGTTLNDKLTWQYHIQTVAKKLSIAIGILSKLRHYVPRGVLIKVYYGIAYPYLLYSVTNWGNAAKTHIQKIQVF